MNVSSSPLSLDRATGAASPGKSLLSSSGKVAEGTFNIPGNSSQGGTSTSKQDVVSTGKTSKGAPPAGGGGGGASTASALTSTIETNKRKVTPVVGATHAADVVSSLDGSIDYQKIAKIVAEKKHLPVAMCRARCRRPSSIFWLSQFHCQCHSAGLD